MSDFFSAGLSVVRELLSALLIVIVALIVTSVILFAPREWMNAIGLDKPEGYLRVTIGIVWLVSLVVVCVVAFLKIRVAFIEYRDRRANLQNAMSATLSAEMMCVLLFLSSRYPSAESLLREEPAVFRLDQLKMIHIPPTPIWFADEFEIFQITDLGKEIIRRRRNEFQAISSNISLQEDVINRISRRRWQIDPSH